MEKKDTERILTIVNSSDTSIAANIDQNYIFTTEDKVRILYDEYNKVRKLSSDAIGWLGIFLTLLISDLTCDFNPFWIFSSEVISAVFLVSTILFFCLFVRSGYYWLRNKDKLEFPFFLEKIKGNK